LKSGRHNNTIDSLWESYDEWRKNGGYDDRMNKTTFSKNIRKKMRDKLVNASTNRAGGCKIVLSLPEWSEDSPTSASNSDEEFYSIDGESML